MSSQRTTSSSTPSKRRRIYESSDEEKDDGNNENEIQDTIMETADGNDDGDDGGDDGDGDDNENNNEDNKNNDKKERRRLRILRELRDLKQSGPNQNPEDQTLFPGDDGYEQVAQMTNDDYNQDADDDDDGDYQEDNEADVDVINPDQEEGMRYLDPVDEIEEEGDGEDLLENAYSDYQRIEALDNYGREGIDDRDFDGMDYDEREAAEAEIAKREEEENKRLGRGRSGRFYEGLMDDVQEDDEARRARRGRIGGGRRADIDDEEVEESEEEEEDAFAREEELFETEEELNLEAFDVPLREWIAQERTRREVMRKFRRFIMTPIDDHDQETQNKRKQKKQAALYEDRIRNMCAANQCTLEISYMHLMQNEPILAIWLVDAPRDMFDVLNEAATRHTMRLFKSYGAIHDEIHVRIADLPIIDSLRGLRRTHLDRLVRVNGVVTRRSSVYPQLKLAYYDCMKCKEVLGPYRVEESSIMSSSGPDGSAKDAATLHQPSSCPSCESTGPFRLNASRTQYRNYQRINLQETPGSVPPGRVPRTKEVVLTNDLIDSARPGEEVEITGIFSHSYDYHLTQKSGFPVFNTFIGSNHIRRKEDVSASNFLTESDKAQILELARDPKIGERIVESIAPSIYGHRHVKTALAMSLFGAVPKNISDKHRIRGDINILLLGDPGTAKSQMLKYAESTAPRAVYSTGKGASAVGLTASVHKDPLTKEWTLEGGALVLADRGVCLIDEFDKMNEQDRTSIHEAMEQQSISISKAGIVTSLQARCSVIAAANPIGGRYDSSCTFSENVELTDPILQRFDLLCVLQDTVDPVADERLANFVTGSHMKSVATSEYTRGKANTPDNDRNTEITGSGYSRAKIIPQDLLRKYIQYARTNVKPVLRGNTFDQEKIASLYVALRKESATSGGVPIAVRHIESIMRLSEAHAKMHLRDYVRDDDMDASIAMMLQSFITAQKFSVRRQLQRSFAKYVSSGEDRAHLLLHILQDMMKNEAMYQTIRLRQRGQNNDMLGALEIPLEEFEGKARDRRIYDVSEFCHGEVFKDAGYILNEKRGIISRDEHT
jgi:DNA replication licensing factor MCM2